MLYSLTVEILYKFHVANRIIGDKQIVQELSIKCSELCKQNGIICLLMPGKRLLFNRSDKSWTYRVILNHRVCIKRKDPGNCNRTDY